MPLIKLKERRVLSFRYGDGIALCKSRVVGQLYQLLKRERETERVRKRGETSWNVLLRNSRPFRSIRTRKTRPSLFCCCKNGQNRRNEIFRSDCTRQERDSALLAVVLRFSLGPPSLLAPFASNPRPRCRLTLLIDSRRSNCYLITSQSGRSLFLSYPSARLDEVAMPRCDV